MPPWLATHGDSLRLWAFVALLTAFSVLEALHPRRPRVARRAPRWLSHGALVVLGAVATRLVAPAGLAGAALWAEAHGKGLLPALGAPPAVAWALGLVALDLAIYVQHRLFHRVPFLWRLHRLHHADRDLDASSAVRFHPLEIVISFGWKAVVIIELGLPVGVVVTYELALSAFAIATHANLGLPAPLERAARALFVTPDLHRIHHSVRREESMANFGTITPTWDRLFRTFVPEPVGGQLGMRIGVEPDGRAAAPRRG